MQRGPALFRRCPVTLVGHDTIALVESLLLAGERLSLSEQADLPGPYLDAVDAARQHLSDYRMAQARTKAKHG